MTVTTKAIFDDDGVVVFLDGSLRDVTGEIDNAAPLSDGIDAAASDNQAALTLDVQGEIIEANGLAAAILKQGPPRRPFQEHPEISGSCILFSVG